MSLHAETPLVGGKSDIINSSEKSVEQNSGLVIEQIRFSELAAKKVVICIVAAAFVIREGNPYSPLLARYGLGELLRVRARVRRDRLHEVLGDAHALLGDLEVLMCLCLMSLVQQVHNAAVVARSLGCQCGFCTPKINLTMKHMV